MKWKRDHKTSSSTQGTGFTTTMGAMDDVTTGEEMDNDLISGQEDSTCGIY
jgi:hypothetical protein